MLKNSFITLLTAALLLTGCQSRTDIFKAETGKKIIDPVEQKHLDYMERQGWYTAETIHRHPFADLIMSRYSNDVTVEEHQYFTDALDEYPKKWMFKNMTVSSVVRWLDNHQIVLSVRSYPGWTAEPNEQPRIIILNVDSGKITDSGYRGTLECLSHTGDMMISVNPRPDEGQKTDAQHNWFIGTWGQLLKEIPWEINVFIPKYLCRFAHYFDPIKTKNGDTSITIQTWMFPLLPEHGVIKETLKTTVTPWEYIHEVMKVPIKADNISNDYKYELIKPNGEIIQTSMESPLSDYFYYQPWDSSYYFTKTARKPSVTFYPSGEKILHHPSRLFEFWTKNYLGVIDSRGTKTGILWSVQSTTRKWRIQGLYLEKNGRLIKIEEGAPSGGISLSHNGCRALVSIRPGKRFTKKEPEKTRVMLIDLCDIGEK